MKRDYTFVDVRLGDELRRAAFLWRHGKDTEHYLYVVDDPHAAAWAVQIYVITDEDHESYDVRELTSVLHWESLLNEFQEARGLGKSDNLRNVVVTINGTRTPLTMHNLVPIDGREFIIYVGKTEKNTATPPTAVMEWWMDGGVPHREMVTDEEMLRQVLIDSGLCTNLQQKQRIVVVCQEGKETPYRWIGLVKLDGAQFLVLSPMTPNNAAGIIRAIYRYTMDEYGEEQLTADLSEELFMRVAHEAGKLEETGEDELEDGDPDDPDNLNIC